MTEPLEPRGAPRWMTTLLIVFAVIIIAVGVCFVVLAGGG